jgi:hypothetical protein
MIFINQWRLPILFVISGMGTAYALSFRSAQQFMKERFMRLYIPLAFGMLAIVPPQVYVERLVNGKYSLSYYDFIISGTFLQGIYPTGNFSWHHLWFLPYLLVFSLLLTPVFIRLRNNPTGKLLQWLRDKIDSQPYFLFTFIVPLYFYEALLEPFFEVTHNLVWDWFNFTRSLTLFFFGFILISIKEVFWNAIEKIWQTVLVTGIISFTCLLIIWLNLEDSTLVHFIEALISVTNLWAWTLTLFGLAATYLNRKSHHLAYANRAVYPFYILHQTVTVLIGFWIYDETWGLLPKFTLLTIGTFGVSFFFYEFIIRRVRWLWVLFGLKN